MSATQIVTVRRVPADVGQAWLRRLAGLGAK